MVYKLQQFSWYGRIQAFLLKHPVEKAVEETGLSVDFSVPPTKPSTTNLTAKRLICNYCKKGFENEDALRGHTRTDHNSGRIRYTIQ